MINSPAQKIKERLTIEDVVSSYIKLEKAGNNLKARCPFHNEKTPSFFISPDRGSYYCFGCGASGDIFTFVQEFEGLDFRGAIKLLASRAGVELGDFNPKEESEKDRLYKAMEEAATYYESNLEKNTEALKYLKDRGLNEKSLDDFRVGFAHPEWREIHTHLRQKGFSDFEIEKAGLAKKSEKGFYDRFRSRIIFPITDSSGRVIAFTGRIFGVEDANAPKYLNSPETPIFNKNAVLYGLDKAKDSIRKNNFSILVEGQMDLILSHQAGYKNAVATSGTALSDSTVSKENVVSNLGLVRRLSPNIVLAFDADKAGVAASERAGRIALSLGMDVKIARMLKGVDPADLISKSGLEEWKLVIKNSKHIIEFLLDGALESAGDDQRKVGRAVREQILPYVNALPSAIEKMHFVKSISDKTGISENALKDDLKQVGIELARESKEIEVARESVEIRGRKENIYRRLVGIALWQRDAKEPKVEANKILQDLATLSRVAENEILGRVESEASDLVFEAEVFYKDDTNLNKDVTEMLSLLTEEYLKEDLAGKMRELSRAEETKDPHKSAEILKECKVLSDKIQEIKNSRK